MKVIQMTTPPLVGKAWFASVMLSLTAAAQAAEDIKTNFSGFGSIIGTTTNKSDVQFKSNLGQTVGAKSGALNFDVDSRIGLQGQAEFSPTVSVTGQVIAQRRSDKDFDPQVEWLYGQWSGIEGLSVRLGRVVLPAFMISDSRFVTYAMAPVRAPVLVYGLFPLSSIDGAQISYQKRLASVNFSITGSTGTSKTENTDAEHVKNFVLSADWGNWTARYGFTGSKVTLHLPAPLGDLKVEDGFQNVGLQYDNGNYFASGEYVLRDTKPNYFDQAAWYITAGARIGKWTPYATVSRQTYKDNGEGVVPTPFGLAPLVSSDRNTSGFAAGLRYDVASNVSLKAELGRYSGASGTVFITNDLGPVKHTVNTLSFGLDFIF